MNKESKLVPKIASLNVHTAVMMNTEQLAERWHTTTGKLANDRCKGVGPRYTKPAGRVLYRLEDVEAYERAADVETFDSPSYAA